MKIINNDVDDEIINERNQKEFSALTIISIQGHALSNCHWTISRQISDLGYIIMMGFTLEIN